MKVSGKGITLIEELNWINTARQFTGLREVKGTRHNPAIVQMLDEMGRFSGEAKAWWRDDDTEQWWQCALSYIQQLGDITKQDTFPHEVEWPQCPI